MSLAFAAARRAAVAVLGAASLAAAPARAVRAQQPAAAAPAAPERRVPETVRGRILDDSGRAVPAAAVTITRGPDRLTRQTAADSAGNYSVLFEEGTGDYLVYVAAEGFASARRRVQRQASERTLVANFTLGRDVTRLAAVRVQANRPERARNQVGPMQAEPGSAERWSEGVQGQVSPIVQGDLLATAGTMAGVTVGPGGPSILGGGAESNLTTLNGMSMAGGSLPRAARTETRVTGATFDPTRGGFSGANIDVRLGRGDRFFQRRNAFVTLDAPALQFTDPIGRSLGAPSGGVRGSVGADGEAIRQALTYNVALDFARSASDPATLLDAGEEALLRAGLSPDSAERLLAVAGPLVPLAGTGVPDLRRRDALTWLGRLDDTRDSLKTRALTTYLGSTREGALGFGPLVAPASGGERRETTLGAQLTLGEYVGPGDRVLVETRLSASRQHTASDPYLDLPGATVLVRSPTLEERADVSSVTLGGNPWLASDEARWIVEGANETYFNARGRRHRFKTQLWARADGLAQEALGNRYGTFAFNSIDDLAAGRAASFTRALVQPQRDGSVWNGAAAAAHTYSPSRFFNVIYGARVEANGFMGEPARNAALEQALGVRTGAAPALLHVSPRVGFTWTYNKNRDNGNGMSMNSVGKFFRSPQGTIRGGIGEFRDLLRPGVLADARAATGLPGGALALTCVGSAVPAADFARFAADPSTIPTECVGGGGVLADRAPSVTLIDPSYDVPRSWRGTLGWSGLVHKFIVSLNALGSWDLSQPGTWDANFAGRSLLPLDQTAEGGRPVYVSAGAIDPASGALSAAESRLAPEFGRVGVRRSDLRGYGGQATLNVAPDMFKFRGRSQIFASAAYTLQQVRRQYRGFDGGGFGDPREVEWAPAAQDARHVVIVQGGFSTSKTGTVTFFGRGQSGLPFTPVVQGDVDGDGRGGDRAFVPRPSAIAASDPELASQLDALLDEGSPSAQRCLRGALGTVPGRNSCRGPWTQSLNVQWRPPIPRKYARRVTTNVYLQNVLGGLDQLFHGSDLRGWGSQFAPDPVLLVPRGFDAQSRRFRYAVNPRFGDTRPARTLLRDPFRLVIDFSVDLAVDYDVQQLRRALEPVRAPQGGWARRTADSLASFYLSRTSSIHKLLLSESDSLFLTKEQVSALQRADSVFSARVRALYVPLGQFLATRPREPGKIELDTVATTQKAYWKVFWEQPEVADSIVTPLQRELMPSLKTMLGISKKDRENSQWMFGNPVTLVDRPKGQPAPSGQPRIVP
ncbi:MAG: carboxypeptidase regulatory-like domain-containing protein [Gemmatimonadaceae bacterium]